MQKIAITGNPGTGLAKGLHQVFPTAEFYSRTSAPGYDLTKAEDQQKFADATVECDIIVLNSALWKFNQTVLLDVVYKKHSAAGRRPHIVCIGSTTDRVKKGGAWLYNAEKKALRDYCNTLGLNGVWGDGPRVSLISFGSLENVQHKHPDRVCMSIEQAAKYVHWIVHQPICFHVNELSVDPIQQAI